MLCLVKKHNSFLGGQSCVAFPACRYPQPAFAVILKQHNMHQSSGSTATAAPVMCIYITVGPVPPPKVCSKKLASVRKKKKRTITLLLSKSGHQLVLSARRQTSSTSASNPGTKPSPPASHQADQGLAPETSLSRNNRLQDVACPQAGLLAPSDRRARSPHPGDGHPCHC